MEPYSSDTSGPEISDIEAIREAVQQAARRREKDCIELLDLLRQLEELHRDIRETFFQESLPTNRQRLYNLLRDIEVSGGWPYIQRMKLQKLLAASDYSILSDSSPAQESSES
ncbi:MAG: hypothetical protein AAF821_13830 [Cyanobacteria bacterium P01_D01_bin.156]